MNKMWQLILAAFCGGIVLSVSELMGMMAKKEMVDIFFFMGMVLAGAIGVGGFFAAGATSIRTAFVAGVSAPQLLGGIAKAAPAGAKALSMLVAGSVAFAQPVMVDSAHVTVIIEGTSDSLKIESGNKVVMVGDSTKIVLSTKDTVMVSGLAIAPVRFVPDSGKQTVKFTVKSASLKARFMRGLFAQQQKSEENKIEVEIQK